MDLGLKGKRALVTGGARGIGQAITVDLAKEGVKVVFTSRKQDKLDETSDMIGGRKQGHYAVNIDLNREGMCEKFAKDVRDNFGELDIVVNNIGDTLNVTDPYCPLSDWRRVFRLNFEIAIEINNLFIPYIKKQNWGRIVNISSPASMANHGPVTFCGAKAALTAYTRSMARILAIEADKVVMSAVLPGVVITEGGYWDTVLKERPEHAKKYLAERCPLGRFGQIWEISPMVVLLCSEQASFCHGAIVPVDAGQSRHYYNVQGL